MSEPLDSLVRGWKSHFASADSSIEWLHSELDLSAELAPSIWLVGTLDAVGRNGAGELFFGEWKTANPREKKTWKQVWRMNPQSLSYGVLAAQRWPEMQRFTVRKAFKDFTYDHAWFKYEQAELEHWKQQLILAAQQIEYWRDPINGWWEKPWDTNFSRCYKYGTSYACPFVPACHTQQWGIVPAGSTSGGDPTWAMTGQRAAILARDPAAIVLSPTTVADWLDCREMYRRKYVELVTPPKSEALTLGGDFHRELGSYYKGMVKI
jgi:hypothetical protein